MRTAVDSPSPHPDEATTGVSGDQDRAAPSGRPTNPRRLDPSRRERLALVVIVFIAAIVRLVTFIELSSSSAFDLHRWAQSDMHFFHTWAEAVAGGDLLSRHVGHPVAAWQETVAVWTALRRGERPADRAAYSRALWDGWYGGPRWHQEPLYAYLVAAALVLGGDVGLVFAAQSVLGLTIVILVWAVTRRLFDPTSALVAATLAALSAPLVFFETVLLRATVVTAIGLALVWVTSLAIERGRRWWWASGVLLGIGILARTMFGLFAVALAAWLVWRRGQSSARAIGALVVGASLAVLPAAARNVAVGAPLMTLSSVEAVVFMTSNFAGYDPAGGFDVSPPEAARILDETGAHAWPMVVATLRTHSGLGSLVAQVAGKAWSAIHTWEKPNNVNIDFHRRLSHMLAALPVTFGLVFPLAVVGAVVGWRTARTDTLVPLVALAAAVFVTMLVAYVLARFRLPLFAAMLPFAGAGVTSIVRAARARQRARLVIAAVFLAAAAMASNRDHPRDRYADFAAAFEVHHGPRAQAAAERGDVAAARRELERYLALEPRTLPPGDEGRLLRQSFDAVRMRLSRAP